jgi:hypothetical protein
MSEFIVTANLSVALTQHGDDDADARQKAKDRLNRLSGYLRSRNIDLDDVSIENCTMEPPSALEVDQAAK